MFPNPWVEKDVFNTIRYVTFIMIVFGNHCNFFVVWPIQLKTCRCNVFFFVLQGKICALEKLGTSQRFCTPEHVSFFAFYLYFKRDNLSLTFPNYYLQLWDVPWSCMSYLDMKLFFIPFSIFLHVNFFNQFTEQDWYIFGCSLTSLPW